MNKKQEKIRNNIRLLVKEYYRAEQKNNKGKTIQYSGITFDDREINAIIDCLLNGWFGHADNNIAFEKQLKKLMGAAHVFLTNSGSSANLLAVSSIKAAGMISNGDEIIVCGSSFPTTINPIIQSGLTPVFIDCHPKTYNIDAATLKNAVSAKTKAVFITHTLGNPCEMNKICKIAEEQGLTLIEDCCDALGAEYDGQAVGQFGELSTLSFYAAHHISTGEGGAVMCHSGKLANILRALREWGRGCYCVGKETLLPGGACKNRFNYKLSDGTPFDHKYLITQIGYNLKALDLQGAMGLVQLKRLPSFLKVRSENFKLLYQFFSGYKDFFILPESCRKAKPAWFSFPLTIQEKAPFTRIDFMKYLESKNIQTRMFFTGNILKHPAYKNIPHRIYGSLDNADKVLKHGFFIGVYPGISRCDIDTIIEHADKFLKKFK